MTAESSALPPPRLHVALYAPRIAQNTGQIARTCFAMNLALHLIRPLGFRIDAASLRRAAVGYWDELQPMIHADVAAFRGAHTDPQRIFLITKQGREVYTDVRFRSGDTLVFGNETEGLPAGWLAAHPGPTVRIPMVRREARCLNLATAATVLIFEALRQLGPSDPSGTA